ncbi:MAG: tetratricopeptide repeat protein [Thiobacillus sp.]
MSDEIIPDLSDQAWSLVDSGRLEEARALFKKICEISGDDPESWMMLGSLHAEFLDMQDATSCLEKSIELDPSYPDAHLNLAKILVNQDQVAEAYTHCKVAVDNDPAYADAWQLLAGIQEKLGDFLGSEASSRKAVELTPDNASCHANLALSLWKQNKLQESVRCYQRALQLDARLVAAWMQLAAVYTQLGAYPDAEQCFRKSIEIAPGRAEAYGQLGDLLIKQKRKDEAIAAFRKALQIKTDDAGVYLQLGWAYQSRKEWDDAMVSFQEAFRLAPDNVNACFGIAAVYLEMGMGKVALEHFEQALQLDPGNEEIQFHIAQLSGARLLNTAPAGYVRKLFDEYADRFDSHLVGELSYKGPELIEEALGEVGGTDTVWTDVLDLGCGTGLCALLFKERALKLSGVDLSEKMIEVAKRRNLYDQLTVGDITVVLEGLNQVHDLIIAADVFVYVGELKRVFELSSAALKRSGLFAFTVEAAKDEAVDYVLQPTGRYAHSKHYIKELAQAFGFVVEMMRDAVLRTDRGVPIHSYTVVMRRQ